MSMSNTRMWKNSNRSDRFRSRLGEIYYVIYVYPIPAQIAVPASYYPVLQEHALLERVR